MAYLHCTAVKTKRTLDLFMHFRLA